MFSKLIIYSSISLLIAGCNFPIDKKINECCFEIRKDQVCINCPNEYLIKDQEETDNGKLLLLVNNCDTVTIEINKVFNEPVDMNTTSLDYLGVWPISTEFVELSMNDSSDLSTEFIYYSLPCITDEYYLQTDLLEYRTDRSIIYKRIIYVADKYVYFIEVKFRNRVFYNNEDAITIISNFILLSINDKSICNTDILKYYIRSK